ncbi:MAG: branched-chain amino acid ABC transporter substrate-binding protein [Gammaproteobacteria bacterium]|uniref:branched-chain amino acid ABC transporter substrate-binding protein n=1 Tax=Rhodoferax sp. TaxID=50421 RepID=UPI0018506A4A|nr:branched-chain amino acid ABC transporter substrate-binding protein [Rhodoferax sp.]MBU3900909.1 branched-chain amino acid ABC transporter substrate-binding protein [Gammaproteobacteria bacterium]MBA3056425.1 branched-chain amino acid ABC transporter substrate-binding protein [Rhodoferax sp.]MBU3998333.1 branched-chain amino acid ABC transporter substrate-binding protein [Gammaproteobacteria bacterium]MBU4017542.1 branched-chain amino acid ABC transporter substrate-binding protein [Gammaprot
MKLVMKFVAGTVAVLCVGGALAQSGTTVKIAFIDPLSGPFANVGQNQLKSWQFVAERLSGAKNPAGVKFEVMGFDNKGSPQESLNSLKAAIDQGFRYVTQGNGSGAGLAISDAVSKHNSRNPGKEVVYLNYAAVDPSMTNDKCDYWHFRLDADTSMKMEALTTFMKDQPSVKNVYLINQNYSHGQQVAKYFKDGIARKRPDVKIVGDDLHPIGQVKDFAPYVAKIKQSGADAIVTGNWGADLTLLVKALNDAGLKLPMYTYYAQVTGTPTALAAAGGEGEVYVIAYGHANHTGEAGAIVADFKKKFNDDYYTMATYNGINLMAAAIAKAKSSDPVKVAAALEGLTVKSFAGEVQMRKSDHQLQQSMFVTKWQKVDKKYPYSVENTGYTFVPVKQMDAFISSTPTSCQMKRPS